MDLIHNRTDGWAGPWPDPSIKTAAFVSIHPKIQLEIQKWSGPAGARARALSVQYRLVHAMSRDIMSTQGETCRGTGFVRFWVYFVKSSSARITPKSATMPATT
ncbi:hypothetical protein FALCPG4_001828 [Fusarium falciforme]